MKKVFYILVFGFSFFNSSCQENTEFKLENSFPITWGDNCITKDDCFHISIDSNYYLISYTGYDGIKRTIDSILRGEAESITLNDFQAGGNNTHVVLLKIEYEFSPYFIAYYINNGNLTKIGEWLVYTPCESCDFQDYPIEGIRVFQKGEEIIFTFLPDTYYSQGNESGTVYKAGDLTLSFNTVNGLLRNTSIQTKN